MTRTRRRSAGATLALITLGFFAGCGAPSSPEPDATEPPVTETTSATATPSLPAVGIVPEPPERVGERGHLPVLPDGPGGGSSAFPDVSQNLADQLPIFTENTLLKGEDALVYADTITNEVPAARYLLGSVHPIIECFHQEGFVATGAFIDPDRRRAAIMMIATDAPLPKIPPGLSSYCLTSPAPPPAPEGMCQERYRYERMFDDISEHYWVYVVGTDPDQCAELREEHNLGPHDATAPPGRTSAPTP